MSTQIQSPQATADGRNRRVFGYVAIHTVLVLVGYIAKGDVVLSDGVFSGLFLVASYLLAVSTLTGALATIATGQRPPDRDSELFGLGLVASYLLVLIIVLCDIASKVQVAIVLAAFGMALVYGLPVLTGVAVLAFAGMVFFQSVGPRLVGK